MYYIQKAFCGSQWPAHRLMWMLINGPIPPGLEVCHDCPGGDNYHCLNPEHLWLGTHQQNTTDAQEKNGYRPRLTFRGKHVRRAAAEEQGEG